MKYRWTVRAMDRNDETFRIFYSSLPFFRALCVAIRYMRKYEKVYITKTRIY